MNASIATTGVASTLGTFAILFLTSKGMDTASASLAWGLLAGAGTAAAHWLHAKFSPKTATPAAVTAAIAAQPPAVQAAIAVQTAASPAVPAVAPTVLLVLILVALMSLHGCALFQPLATAPTTQEESRIASITQIATIAAITGTNSNATVWKDRATQFKAAALKLQAANDSGTATLATLNADLQPELAKLKPLDAALANALIVALQPYLTQAANDPVVLNTQTRVDVILSAVIAECAAYGA